MWQLLIGAAAAAVVGSTGIAAKRFLKPNADVDATQGLQKKVPDADTGDTIAPAVPTPSIACDEEGIFRFSTTSDSSRMKCDRARKKKLGFSGRQLKHGGGDGEDKVEKDAAELEAKCGRRRAGVCLKKRRTAKAASSKSGSSSSSSKEKVNCPTQESSKHKTELLNLSDSSLFGWGLGVGMICMMSAGQVEITKLSAAMEETSKVVNELRSELDKKKFRQFISTEHIEPVVLSGSTRTSASEPSGTKTSGHSAMEDAECPSSVLTEEHNMEMLEMDQLEAELESELQKLPLTANPQVPAESLSLLQNSGKAEVSTEAIRELEGQTDPCFQFQGVVPTELDKKLCHVLIEQQGNQIVELESELYLAQAKLQEKEAELRAMKDCVKRLTDFSLSNASDDDAEVQEDQPVLLREWESRRSSTGAGCDPKRSVVGMKRPIDSTNS